MALCPDCGRPRATTGSDYNEPDTFCFLDLDDDSYALMICARAQVEALSSQLEAYRAFASAAERYFSLLGSFKPKELREAREAYEAAALSAREQKTGYRPCGIHAT